MFQFYNEIVGFLKRTVSSFLSFSDFGYFKFHEIFNLDFEISIANPVKHLT